MTLIKEFREFASRGNVIDLAVGVIIGAAFGKIVTSIVNDLIMPPIGMLLGRINFKDFFFALDRGQYPTLEAAQKASAPIIAYGQLLNTIVEFLIIAAAVFMLVRQINRLKTPAPAPPSEEARDCPLCLSRIPKKASRCAHCTADVQPAV